MDRLIEIIKPKKVFMGEKDFQQFFLVKKYFKKNKSKIVPCKTIRDINKLALSSRNLLLKKNELIKAAKLAQNIISFKKELINKKNLNKLIILKKKNA